MFSVEMTAIVATSESDEKKIPRAFESTGINGIQQVVVHPLVLLSVVDHYNRLSTTSGEGRAVGVLLGTFSKGQLDVANSFASGSFFIL